MRTYKIAKGWAVFIYLFAPLLALTFLYLLFLPVIPGAENDALLVVYPFVAVVSVTMLAVTIIGLRDVKRSKFVIEENRIYSVGSFANRELNLDEIKGYRIVDKYILIEPSIPGKKTKIGEYLFWKDRGD